MIQIHFLLSVHVGGLAQLARHCVLYVRYELNWLVHSVSLVVRYTFVHGVHECLGPLGSTPSVLQRVP